jgi:hypothetical protein
MAREPDTGIPAGAKLEKLYHTYFQQGQRDGQTGGMTLICGDPDTPAMRAMTAGYQAGYHSVPEDMRRQAVQAARQADREAAQ